MVSEPPSVCPSLEGEAAQICNGLASSHTPFKLVKRSPLPPPRWLTLPPERWGPHHHQCPKSSRQSERGHKHAGRPFTSSSRLSSASRPLCNRQPLLTAWGFRQFRLIGLLEIPAANPGAGQRPMQL